MRTVFATQRLRVMFVLVMSCLLVATGARGGFLPLDNQSVAFSRSTAGDDTDEWTDQAAGGFNWNGLAFSQADDEILTSASAAFIVATQSDGDSCLYADGRGSGNGNGPAMYSHSGYGQARLLFIVNQTQEYIADLHLDQYEFTGTEHVIELCDPQLGIYWQHTTAGITSIHGRIAPGSYWLIAKTDYSATNADGRSWGFLANMCFTPCVSIIGQQPQDQTVPQGATIDIQLTPVSPLAQSSIEDAQTTTTYQWRKNLQNLVNGGRISGVGTPHLAITNAARSDSGLYDCVVTQGTIVEPSRQAHITVQSVTTVEASSEVLDLQFSAPKPNPFTAGTMLQVRLARRDDVSLAVYDIRGRRVKTLVPLTYMGPGNFAFNWNGRDEDGARVSSGVYFVRLTAGETRLVRRAVLVTGDR